jgi:hypothetical protein
MRQEFEYKTERVEALTSDILNHDLNRFGKDGWELTSLIPFGVHPAFRFLAIFKRTIHIMDC